jgi:hypothetical protein
MKQTNQLRDLLENAIFLSTGMLCSTQQTMHMRHSKLCRLQLASAISWLWLTMPPATADLLWEMYSSQVPLHAYELGHA